MCFETKAQKFSVGVSGATGSYATQDVFSGIIPNFKYTSRYHAISSSFSWFPKKYLSINSVIEVAFKRNKYDFNSSHLRIPITIGFVHGKRLRVYGDLGPYYSIKMSNNVICEDCVGNKMNGHQFGWRVQIGGEFLINDKIGIRIFYNRNNDLNYLYSEKSGSSGGGEYYVRRKIFSSLLGVSAVYYFSKD